MKNEKRLNEFPIFSVLSHDECADLTECGEILNLTFTDTQIIAENAVYCVLSGKAAVYSVDESHPILLRYLNSGDIFGVATLYSDEGSMSRIEAKGSVTLLSVPRAAIDRLIAENAKFRNAYLSFLSNRIAFLNGKISCIAAGSAERKLAAWLLNCGDVDDFDLPVSVSDLARLLDLGRASLYRAFDDLSEKGSICKDGNHIAILNRPALQNELNDNKQGR